jgi:LDH2 family malate/lactate/ureidoglycolate dehydrogenase
MRVEPRRLAQAVALILTRAGAEPDIAAEVTESLVESDCAGHASHGVRLVELYVERLRAGDVSGTARPLVSSDTGPLIAIDGNLAFGQIVGAFAVRRGIEAAKRHGVAAVAVSRSGHFGRNGKWPEMAAAEGIASVHFINSPNTPSAIVPHGGRDARLTSNPVALGAPHPDGDHLILDFSVAEVAVNAIKLAAVRGERLPGRCVFDANGELTDDPAAFLESPARAILAFGGFKGYALGVFTEIFAGAIAGGLCHTGESAGKPVNNMLSIYLDPAALRPAADYARNLRLLIEWLRRPDAAGERATLPGDRSRATKRRSEQDGLDLDESTLGIIAKAAALVGADAEVRELLKA